MPDLVDLLRTLWGLARPTVEPLGGGLNSATWLVLDDSATYIAKQVPASGVEDLVRGARAATRLADAGLVTGPPVPGPDGRLVATEHGLTLLEYVPGVELDGDSDDDQIRIARTPAGVHRADGPVAATSPQDFFADWLTPTLPGLVHHPWLLAALASVRAETDPLTVTSSLLHTDPTPSAFRRDPATGVTGLVDWAGARRGPVLYDLDGTGGLVDGARSVELRYGAALRRTLETRGWVGGDAWACFTLDLSHPVPAHGLRLEAVDGASGALDDAVVRDVVAAHRASWERSRFSVDALRTMTEGPAFRRGRFLVLHDGRVPVATACVWSAGAGRPGLIEPLGVDQAHRGRGHGRAVLRACAAALQEMGATSMRVATPVTQWPAVPLYASAMTRLPDHQDLVRPVQG